MRTQSTILKVSNKITEIKTKEMKTIKEHNKPRIPTNLEATPRVLINIQCNKITTTITKIKMNK